MSTEDINNEIRAVVKLCAANQNENIVQVIRWGQLPKSPYFFIDMELCDFNLETYVLQDWKPDVARKIPHFANFDLLTPPQRLAQMLTIMRDIVNGVAFIHRNNEVHRDLKPRNGTYSAKKFSAANG